MEELEKVSQYVSPRFTIAVIIVVIALVIAIITASIKLIPVLKSLHKSANQYEGLMKQVQKNTNDIKNINQRLDKDYDGLNNLKEMTVKQQEYIDESLEERELIIKSLLGVVQGLQEVGANGPTKKAEAEIQAFLLKKSHKTSNHNQ